ncbi:hypothetical protein [Armatimonas sp.]|uniref:hypothetical protein n=1 Tax=Armatimonas sp. TaxID=1872638 RepID=UPI00286B307F|nr:hypothetical protein [Armatimonas sp.]
MSPLILAAIPAFLGSLYLMHRGGAPSGQIAQQAIVFCIVALACALFSRKPRALTDKSRDRALIVAAVLIALPLLLPSTGPQRWLGAGGFRLYIASVVLPSTVLLLPQARSGGVILLLIAAALAAQPDASQATAFALAGVTVLLRMHLSGLARIGMSVALAGAATVVWLRPDPLEPVLYVEGVLALALTVSPIALMAALIALALPVVVLLRLGQTPVAIYYLAIYFFAYRQLTPMPLLGFGVGPILGYFSLLLCRLPDPVPIEGRWVFFKRASTG